MDSLRLTSSGFSCRVELRKPPEKEPERGPRDYENRFANYAFKRGNLLGIKYLSEGVSSTAL